MNRNRHKQAFSLLEILLVTGVLAVLAAMIMPNLLTSLTKAQLPESARQMRALLQLTRAHAMLDGRRYRIRLPRADEIDGQGETRQPVVEVEDEPLEKPDVFRPVLASWAQDATLKRNIRCARVRLGKPTVEQLLGEVETDEELEEELAEALEEAFEEGFPPLILEPDGTSEWATFLLTDAPGEIEYEELDPQSAEYEQIEVILDGLIGLVWLQRPLYEEELEMMREHGWPPVMRKDFLDPVSLTEENVLEIRETRIGR